LKQKAEKAKADEEKWRQKAEEEELKEQRREGKEGEEEEITPPSSNPDRKEETTEMQVKEGADLMTVTDGRPRHGQEMDTSLKKPKSVGMSKGQDKRGTKHSVTKRETRSRAGKSKGRESAEAAVAIFDPERLQYWKGREGEREGEEEEEDENDEDEDEDDEEEEEEQEEAGEEGEEEEGEVEEGEVEEEEEEEEEERDREGEKEIADDEKRGERGGGEGEEGEGQWGEGLHMKAEVIRIENDKEGMGEGREVGENYQEYAVSRTDGEEEPAERGEEFKSEAEKEVG
jgi:hypothetical protein